MDWGGNGCIHRGQGLIFYAPIRGLIFPDIYTSVLGQWLAELFEELGKLSTLKRFGLTYITDPTTPVRDRSAVKYLEKMYVALPRMRAFQQI